MEPRTVVHTKRCYGNFPVSLVKHAQENCQKIQDLKECKFECCVKCKVYRVYKLECIKMFFHSKSGWERQWSVSVWAVFQLSPTAREFYVLPDQKDATPRTISPSSLYRCICKCGKRVALQTSQACIVIHWQVDPFRVRFFFFFPILKVVARSSLLLKPLVERSFLLGRIGAESAPLDSALWRRLYQLLPRWVPLRPKDWRKSKEGPM